MNTTVNAVGEDAGAEKQINEKRTVLARVARRMPWTKAFDVRIRGYALRASRRRYSEAQKLKAVKALDEESRHLLRRRLVRIAFLGIWEGFVDFAGANVVLSAFLLSFLAGPAVAVAFGPVTLSWSLLVFIPLAVGMSIPIYRAVFFALNTDWFQRRGVIIWNLAAATALGLLSYELLTRWNDAGFVAEALLAALLSVGFALVSVHLFGFLSSYLDYRLRRRNVRKYAVSFLSSELLYALDLVESGPLRKSAELRSHLCLHLEQAARCVEEFLPEALDPGDAETDRWVRSELAQVSAGLREIKKTVLLDASSKVAGLAKPLQKALTCSLTGTYQDMPRCAPAERTVVPRRVRVQRLARTLIVAVLPIVAFALLQLSAFALDGRARSYIGVGTAAWLVVTLLDALDPHFGRRIDTAKDVARQVSVPRQAVEDARARATGAESGEVH